MSHNVRIKKETWCFIASTFDEPASPGLNQVHLGFLEYGLIDTWDLPKNMTTEPSYFHLTSLYSSIFRFFYKQDTLITELLQHLPSLSAPRLI